MFKHYFKPFKDTKNIIFIALLIATEIVLTRYIAIQTPTIRIGFGFIPLILIAMLYGPIAGGTAAAIADVLGMLIFPKGAYFPGFTLSAFIGGVIFGMVLYKKPKNLFNIILAVFLVTVIKDLLLNTTWLTIIIKVPYNAILVERIIKSSIMLIVQIVTIPFVWKRIGLVIQTSYLKS